MLVGLLAVAGAAVWFFALRHEEKGGSDAGPASEVVRRGDVRSTVAGVGTLQPKKSVSLGFGAAGRVTAVEVTLGQKVRAGQVLARLDDTLPRQVLAAARSQAVAAEAKEAQLLEGHTAQERDKVATEGATSARAARAAKRSLAKARRVAEGEVANLRAALHHARETHQAASRRLSLNSSKLSRRSSQTAGAKAKAEAAKATAEAARAKTVAMAGTKEATRRKAEEEEASERKRIEEEEAKERKKAEEEERREREEAEAEGKPFNGRESRPRERAVIQRNPEAGLASAEAQAQADSEIAQARLTEAQSAYERLRGEVDTLRNSLPELRETVRTSDEAVATATTALRSGKKTAAQTVRTAVEAAETAASSRRTTDAAGVAELQPTKAGEMAEAMAAISQARSTVASDEKALAETVLRAPTAGRVANLKLAVGDVVSGGQTAQASAASAGASGGEGGEGASSEGGSSEATSGSGAAGASTSGPSVTLTSPRLRLFAVLLTQADAVKVKSGDTATLEIDALHRQVKGRLTSITPLPQVKNGVVNYTATIATEDLPQQLRVGMTAEVTVLTAEHHDVPVLPLSALPASAGTVKVQVLDHGRRQTRTVQLGLAGDQTVELKKGLRPGDRVVLPSSPGGESEASFEGGFEEGFEE